jgi:hypothetical protein
MRTATIGPIVMRVIRQSFSMVALQSLRRELVCRRAVVVVRKLSLTSLFSADTPRTGDKQEIREIRAFPPAHDTLVNLFGPKVRKELRVPRSPLNR